MAESREPHAEPERAPESPRRRFSWYRLGLAVVVAGLLAAVLAPRVLSAVGNWLVVADELRPADAIFVHAGYLPFREIAGARLYRDGIAPEVWIAPIASTPESRALAELGVEQPPFSHWRIRALAASGVPEGSIRLLDQEVLTTAEEIAAVIDRMRRDGVRTVVLVSSKQHSRRIRMLWNRLADAGIDAIVRPSESDPLDPNAWWTNTDDAQAVLHELAGIAVLWLGIDGPEPRR